MMVTPENRDDANQGQDRLPESNFPEGNPQLNPDDSPWAEPQLDSDLQSDSDDEEVSLDQLSQAYAKVFKKPNHREGSETEFDSDNASDKLAVKKQGTPEAEGAAGKPSAGVSSSDQEMLDNAGCPITPDSIVEALLFVGAPANSKLTVKKIASMLRDVTPNDVQAIVQRLNGLYEREQTAYRIKSQDGVLSMELDESMFSFQQVYLRKNRGIKLNPATIEVLAVVAYKQPVTREQIDSVRKKSSSAILNQLVRRGLVTAQPRSEKSEVMFVTTDKFLDFFNLTDVADLPQSQDVSDLEELIP